MKTIFHDWKIDGYKATSMCGKYQLWIANGFLSFRDNDPYYPKETLLKGIGWIQKWKIWKELCKERNYRAKNFYDHITKTNKTP